MKSNKTLFSWNWSAVFFGYLWLLGRKMYLYAIIFLFTSIFLQVIMAILIEGLDIWKINLIINVMLYFALGFLGNFLYLVNLSKKINEIQKKYKSYKLNEMLIKSGRLNIFFIIAGILLYITTFLAFLLLPISRFSAYEISPQFDEVRYFVKGVAPVGFKSNSENEYGMTDNWGYVDEYGYTQISPRFSWALEFSEHGLAPVKSKSNGKWGYIDFTGKYIIKNKFTFGSKFAKNGLAPVVVGDKAGYINLNGEFVINPSYAVTYSFSDNGLASISFDGQKFGYIDSNNSLVISPIFDWADQFTSSKNIAPVKMGSKWGYINDAGNILIKPQFSAISYFRDSGVLLRNPLAPVKVNDKWGYINAKGEFLIKPIYDGALEFSSNGLAPVMIGDKWAYINDEGELFTDFIYDEAHPFDENRLAGVCTGKYQNRRCGYISDGSFIFYIEKFIKSF